MCTVRLGATVAATSKTEKAKTAAVVVPAGATPEAIEGLVSSVLASMYHDTRFKSGDGLLPLLLGLPIPASSHPFVKVEG